MADEPRLAQRDLEMIIAAILAAGAVAPKGDPSAVSALYRQTLMSIRNGNGPAAESNGGFG